MSTTLTLDRHCSNGESISLRLADLIYASVHGLIDVKEPKFLTAGGTMALRQGKDRTEFLAPHLQAVRTQAKQIQ